MVDDIGLEECVAARRVHTRIRVPCRVRLRVDVVLLAQLLVDVRQHGILLALLVTRGQVEHCLMLAATVVAGIVDQLCARRPGNILLLRIRISEATLIFEQIIGRVKVGILHDRLARIHPRVAIARLAIVDLGIFECDRARAALERVNLHKSFLLGPLAVRLHEQRLGRINDASITRVRKHARLIADLIRLAIDGEIGGAANSSRGKSPHVPVVAHVQVCAILCPTDQCAANRRLDLVVIVFGVPELRRNACCDRLRRTSGKIV